MHIHHRVDPLTPLYNHFSLRSLHTTVQPLLYGLCSRLRARGNCQLAPSSAPNRLGFCGRSSTGFSLPLEQIASIHADESLDWCAAKPGPAADLSASPHPNLWPMGPSSSPPPWPRPRRAPAAAAPVAQFSAPPFRFQSLSSSIFCCSACSTQSCSASLFANFSSSCARRLRSRSSRTSFRGQVLLSLLGGS